jgi:DNA repair protein RadA/Sms
MFFGCNVDVESGYAHVGMCKLSANHNLLAYTIDKKGSEEFTLFVKDLRTGELLSQHTTEGVVSVEWAQTEPSLFYTVVDNVMRPFK